MSGCSLAEICAAFADREDPAVAAHEAMSGWMGEGWIVATRRGAAGQPDTEQ
jgi:hypothetical protein